MSIDNTLKLTDERLREIHAALCGATTWHELGGTTGIDARPIRPGTLHELASLANELISKRCALAMYESDAALTKYELQAMAINGIDLPRSRR